MKLRLLKAAAALALLLAVAVGEPATANDGALSGWASAYAPGVMEATIAYRLENDLWRVPPPRDWYEAAGAIATNDCSQVGAVMTLIDPDGREWRVLVADCGGDDGGAEWMTRHNVVAELDARLWARLTAAHGRPLAVRLR